MLLLKLTKYEHCTERFTSSELELAVFEAMRRSIAFNDNN